MTPLLLSLLTSSCFSSSALRAMAAVTLSRLREGPLEKALEGERRGEKEREGLREGFREGVREGERRGAKLA